MDKTVIYGFYQKGHPEVKNKIPSQAGRDNAGKANWEGAYACWRRRKRYYAIIWPKIEKKSILHVGPQPKIGKKCIFFNFSKNAPDHLYISKKHVECV